MEIELLRVAVIDGVRRPRGWTGEITKDSLPADYYVVINDKKQQTQKQPKEDK